MTEVKQTVKFVEDVAIISIESESKTFIETAKANIGMLTVGLEIVTITMGKNEIMIEAEKAEDNKIYKEALEEFNNQVFSDIKSKES